MVGHFSYSADLYGSIACAEDKIIERIIIIESELIQFRLDDR